MAHISSIGAGIYSDLSVCKDEATNKAAIAGKTVDLFHACFAATKYERIQNVREFPAMGTPPNIVNVPVYGQATSQQVQGQADAPSMEITINYVASEWADGGTLGEMVGDGKQHCFRFLLLNSKPINYNSVGTPTLAGDTSDMNVVENSMYYWIGKIEALVVNPQLTDANTATITISVQSDFYGAYTLTPTP